jgi:hypothetical protein
VETKTRAIHGGAQRRREYPMLDIPTQLKNDYTRLLPQRGVPSYSHNYYLKWLCFYHDFCNRYHHAPSLRSSLPLFIRKLHEKGQTPPQQKQASHVACDPLNTSATAAHTAIGRRTLDMI